MLCAGWSRAALLENLGLRHVHPERRPTGRVAASGGGNRREWLTCRRGGPDAGESRDTAKGKDLRTADYAASPGCDQRWKAAATGNKTPVSGNSRSLRSGFVREGQGQSRHSSADVLFTCRGGSRDTEAVSPSGARDNRGSSLRRLFPLP